LETTNLLLNSFREKVTLTMSTPPLENVTPAPFLSQVRPFLRRVTNCVDTPPDNYDSPLMNHPYGINESAQLENAH